MTTANALPVDAILGNIETALGEGTSAVLVAPPGAGKTTRVPLALLDAPWLAGRKILMLEPRRIAARAAAEHMAHLRGERLGETVGLRARLATAVGPKTRIEVLTEGVFTRLILDDPALEGVGAVLFDEFHERSLNADFGLALALDVRAGLRPDLRLLVMSATLDAAGVAVLLGQSPIIQSHGRSFPVTTRYLGRDPTRRIEDAMAAAIVRSLEEDPGSILAFLPGQAEISRTVGRLDARELGQDIDIVPLHGGLGQEEQRRAIAPPAPGRRKVVLATTIAETSITIDGVRIVIDCGLQRVPRYDPGVGLTRLETVRVSRASADQRRGRAGRTEPGVCYRLWSEPETAGLPPFNEPEIRAADLSGVLLDCAAWGVSDPTQLQWLDPPPQGALIAARADLQELGALDSDGGITHLGRRMRALPLPPRLARMLLAASAHGAADLAAEVAAVLVEQNLGGRESDLTVRLNRFRHDRSRRATAMRHLARQWARDAQAGASPAQSSPPAGMSPAALLALAYPDRIGKARSGGGQFLLANGRGARLDAGDPLASAPYLAVAEMTGSAADARILLAAELAESEVCEIAGDRIAADNEITFDMSAAALRARRVTRLGAIQLASEPRPLPHDAATAAKLARGIARLGIARLPWSKAQSQLRHRVAFVRGADNQRDGAWPDLSDAALADTVEQWLAPFIVERASLAEISPDDVGAALGAVLPWPLKRRLDKEAPTHFTAPTGNRHAIDYESEGAPILAIRVQEVFGLKQHPAIAEGRLPLTLHLLSPAGRPMQITRDLPGFWRGSWADVRAEMKGRYPRHPWPEDPANAKPTARAKPRAR